MFWLRLLFVLLINAIPLYGIGYLGWSISVVLLLFWVENLLVAFFTSARIVLHRALTRKLGHVRTGQLGGVTVNGKARTFGLFGEYAIVAFPFTLVHGIFVFAIVFAIGGGRGDDPAWQFSFEQFRYGALQMLGVMAIDFLLDAATMRSRSFAWIKAYAGQRMGRVFVLHLGIIFGMWALAASESPYAVLYTIIVLKTLWDLAAGGSTANASAMPAEPPRWTTKLANRVDKDKGGGAAKMRADWKRSIDDAKRAAIEDEKVEPA